MISSTLADHLEVWGFESGLIVYKDFSLGQMLRLQPLDIGCSTAGEISQIKVKLMQMLNSLPEGMKVQFHQEIRAGSIQIIEEFQAAIHPEANSLVKELIDEKARNLVQQEEQGLIPKVETLLTVRLPFEQMPAKPGLFKGFLNGESAPLSDQNLTREVHRFLRELDKIKSSLQSAGLGVESLSESEMFQTLYSQWNPDLPSIPEIKDTSDLRDQLIQTDQVLGLDAFSLGRIYHKVLSLKQLPEMTYASMIEVMRGLPFGSSLVLTFEVLNQAKERSQLETQRRVAFASVTGKKGVSDLDSEAKLKDLEGLLGEMVQGNEQVFQVSMNVILKSTSEEDLDLQVSQTLHKFRELSGAEGFLETYGVFDVFKEISLPNARSATRGKKMNTSVLSDFLPVFGLWSGHSTPRMLLKNTEGSLFAFDPFSSELTNYNQLVSGGSGSGKSFSAVLMILQMLKERPKVFILDIGGSYKRLVSQLGGQYIELGLKSEQSINPLDMAGLSGSDEEVLDQKVKFLVSLIETMTKENEFTHLGRFEKSEIERAVKSVLREKNTPFLRDIQFVLVRHPEESVTKIGKILNLWCGDSPYGKFVDRPTSLALERELICFDLKGMESHPDLQAAALFIITDLIWREVQRDRTQKKIVVLDESWRLLQSDSACLFIGDIFRTFRKYLASAVAISQTIEDFSKSKVASAILPNSSIKWILRQKGDPKEIESVLRLNAREMEHVNGLVSIKGQFSEVFLMAEDRRQVVRIEASPLDYWIATTDPMDLRVLEYIHRENPSLTEIEVLRLAAKKFPQGASQPEAKAGRP